MSTLARFSAGELGTADVADELAEAGREVRACALQLRSFGGAERFAGRVRTVRCRDDNVLLRGLLETPGDGAVLVVDGEGSLECALVGDVVAGLAVEHGWAGIVLNAAVRDVAALAQLPLGIRALGSNPRRSAKGGVGEVDVPVSFGGVTFAPGDSLLADEDGILAVAG